ncbi:alpha-glucosidase [Pedobacter sp. AK017]|uniref:glycoside hydrolase family 97 protein n=1 Tax=Pedobacter sp. AK017 TaxID=2723073 RepID=UPI0016184CCA|nr:glycoside hydrolase family 97 protein [Pedobacter sp. AK017]MBB5440795.1 alpha-glucosidase [Pedobacter sp. AK017]
MILNKVHHFFTLFLALSLSCIGWNTFSQTKPPYKVTSPDQLTAVTVNTATNGDLKYMLSYNGQAITGWSELGLELNKVTIGRQALITSATQQKHTEKFEWTLGENEFVENNYNELNLSCTSGTIKYNLLVRVFNGAIAFRYILPAQRDISDFVVKRELTAFNFNQPYKIYQYHHESIFTPTDIDSLATSCDFPATLTNGKFYMSIGEAANLNYTKAEIAKGESSNSLKIVFPRDMELKFSGAFETPWRTVSFSNTAIGLHQYSDLYLKLNPASAVKVPESIVPGKLIRAQLNTQSGLDCIDFARKMNFKHIMFDAGWYGPERASSSDPRVAIPEIDLQKVIQYGKENGIGVILYVNYIGLQNYLDQILPLYKNWGVAGIKFGFIDGFSQKGLTWLSSAIRKVNDQGLMLNIHDNYKPTGLSRTFPALLTQEGIRGDENSPDAFHTTVLPYTRFLAGAADFTFCFPNPKNSFSKNIKVSKAQQLALTVVYFSPLQAIFWYGKPTDYTNWDEIEFFREVPTTWDESKYLKGEIGESISVARRKGTTWFVGNAAGFQDWKGDIILDFLSAGKKYTATIYEDSPDGSISKRTVPVKKADRFSFEVKAKGGLAMIIVQQ